MKVLWVMRHAGFARNYEPVIRALAAGGHEVTILHESARNKLGERATVERLQAEVPGFAVESAPEPGPGLWTAIGPAVRATLDYARYHEPAYRDAPLLRERAEKFVPAGMLPVVRGCAALGRPGRGLLRAGLAALERALPVPDEVTDAVRRHRPDLLVVTPLVDFGSRQVDYLKAAQRAGVPTALGVASWDNLTNKGLIRWQPDAILVWNEAQKAEAVELHGMRPGSVVVTGAQLFDHWFGWRPRRDREAFCRQVGLDPRQPYLLYLGSSPFLAPEEVGQVRAWVSAVRADARLREVGVMVRPHPNNTRQWVGPAVEDLRGVVVWPEPGSDPFAPEFKDDLFDSLYHSAAVVGINTSAQIEAAIVGRAVCALPSPEAAHAQEGTLHFRHIAGTGDQDGLLFVAADVAGHLEHLRGVLDGTVDVAGRCRRFVERFVRPHGLDAPATPKVVEALLRIAATRPAPSREPVWARPVRAVLFLPAQVARAVWENGKRPWWAVPLRLGFAAGVWGLVAADRARGTAGRAAAALATGGRHVRTSLRPRLRRATKTAARQWALAAKAIRMRAWRARKLVGRSVQRAQSVMGRLR